MTAHRFHCLLCALLLVCLAAYGKTTETTIKAATGEQVRLSYEMRQQGRQFDVIVSRAQAVYLPHVDSRKVGADEFKVLFIEQQRADYGNGLAIEGNSHSHFSVAAGVSYTPSQRGVRNLSDDGVTTLSFTLSEGTDQAVQPIPIVVARYLKKGRMKVVANCGYLNIELKTKTSSKPVVDGDDTDGGTTVEIEGMPDEEDTMTPQILDDIASVEGMLQAQTSLPFSQELLQRMALLRQKQQDASLDGELQQRIDEVLQACDDKQQELAATEQQREDKMAAQTMADIAKLDSLLAVQEELPMATGVERQRSKLETRLAEPDLDENLRAKLEETLTHYDDKLKELEQQQKQRSLWTRVGLVVLGLIGVAGSVAFSMWRKKREELARKRDLQEAEQRARQEVERYARQNEQKIKKAAREMKQKAWCENAEKDGQVADNIRKL